MKQTSFTCNCAHVVIARSAATWQSMLALTVASNCVAGVDGHVFVFIFGPTLSPPPLSRPAGRKRGASFGHVNKQGKYPCRGTLNTKMDLDFGIGNSIFGIGCSGSHAVMRRRVTQTWADQGWRCLSAASLARPRPSRVTQLTGAAGRRIRLSFLSVPFLWTSKERELACRGETRLAARHLAHHSQAKPGQKYASMAGRAAELAATKACESFYG